MRIARLVIPLLFSSAALGSACPSGDIGMPASFDTVVRPAVALDTNPDSNVLEVFLTARPALWDFGTGSAVSVWTYNGVIPGPTLFSV
jgi:FtsP/CotA-like multicopper oxidase with cupredoxin domain